MNNENRIKIAEAMGWAPNDPPQALGWWHNDRLCELRNPRQGPPDPYTNANDTEAVIRWLRDNGWMMTHIRYRGETDHIVIQHIEKGKHGWAGDDWKAGVCELALKVINQK